MESTWTPKPHRDAWTRFMDMHSGGRTKIEPYNIILIEAPESEAVRIFEKRFDRDPFHVTCGCCGEDYSVSESPTLERATGYDRGCRWDDAEGGYVERPSPYSDRLIPLAEYIARPDVLVIRKAQP